MGKRYIPFGLNGNIVGAQKAKTSKMRATQQPRLHGHPCEGCLVVVVAKRRPSGSVISRFAPCCGRRGLGGTIGALVKTARPYIQPSRPLTRFTSVDLGSRDCQR